MICSGILSIFTQFGTPDTPQRGHRPPAGGVGLYPAGELPLPTELLQVTQQTSSDLKCLDSGRPPPPSSRPSWRLGWLLLTAPGGGRSRRRSRRQRSRTGPRAGTFTDTILALILLVIINCIYSLPLADAPLLQGAVQGPPCHDGGPGQGVPATVPAPADQLARGTDRQASLAHSEECRAGK